MGEEAYPPHLPVCPAPGGAQCPRPHDAPTPHSRSYAQSCLQLRRGHRVTERITTALVHLERSEEHTSELQSLMRISYAVFCLKNTKSQQHITQTATTLQQPT